MFMSDQSVRKLVTRRRLRAWAMALTAMCVAGAWSAGTASASGIECSNESVSVQAGLFTQHVDGTYCRPAGTHPDGIMLLVPGGTYNRAYWDFPYQPDTYSFAHAAARAGIGAFAIDLIGTGQSSRPLSPTITATSQASSVHQVISHLRTTGSKATRSTRCCSAPTHWAR